MKGNIGQLMKQAQAMQENMQKMQDQLATLEVEGQSGAGLVKVQMTCKYDVKRVSIDPSLVGDDKEMLEDLVAAAFGHVGLDWERHVRVDPAFLRGKAELHNLVGDASKARRQLGWRPEVGFEQLVQLLVDADLARLRSVS